MAYYELKCRCSRRYEIVAATANSKPRRARPTVDSVGIAVTLMVTVVVELLFAGFGSTADVVTEAVFEITVPCARPFAVCTVRVTVAVPLPANVPREHVTVVVPLQLPCDGVAETNVTPEGRTSVTETFAALLGPPLLTVSV
jgi:hypothetical protein